MDDPPGTDSPQRARQCQYLYERVLHAVLRTALAEEAAAASEGQGEGAAELTAAQRHATVERALEDEDMQLGLITACVEVVNFAYLRSGDRAFPWVTLQLGRMHHTLELWQGCDWIVDHTERPPEGTEGCVPGIPEEVAEYLAAIQVRVEEELAFIDGSAIFRRIMATGASWAGPGSSNPAEAAGAAEAADVDMDGSDTGSPGKGRGQQGRRRKYGGRSTVDAVLVGRFLSNLGRTAMLRTFSVCKEVLAQFPALHLACPALPERVCVVMDVLLSEHLELVFGQHLSVCLACAIYYTVRLHGEMLPFRKITWLMAEVLPHHDEATFSRVELPPEDGTGWDGSRDYGDTRAYYNRVFLPPFAAYDASQLFGDDLAPTPSRRLLEAPQPATRSGTAGDGGKHASEGGQEAGAAGHKQLRKQQRRPLGLVSTNSKASAGH